MKRLSGNRLGPVDRVLFHESWRIPYRLHLGRRRGLRISVTPDLIVNVFAPQSADDSWVEGMVSERASWIIKTLDKVATCKILTLPDRCETGDAIPYLGMDYRLVVTRGEATKAQLLFDTLIVTLLNPDDGRAAGRVVERWYRRSAADQFGRSVDKCLPAVARFGVREPLVTVRNMRSRWGSCSSTGRVSLNIKLVMVPEMCIDYVVMHELCHMVHHDHSKRYYRLLTACMPDWKERKRTLDRYRMR